MRRGGGGEPQITPPINPTYLWALRVASTQMWRFVPDKGAVAGAQILTKCL